MEDVVEKSKVTGGRFSVRGRLLVDLSWGFHSSRGASGMRCSPYPYRQRRLAHLKLKKKDDGDGADEREKEVVQKTAQAKLLELLGRAKNHRAVVGECWPVLHS